MKNIFQNWHPRHYLVAGIALLLLIVVIDYVIATRAGRGVGERRVTAADLDPQAEVVVIAPQETISPVQSVSAENEQAVIETPIWTPDLAQIEEANRSYPQPEPTGDNRRVNEDGSVTVREQISRNDDVDHSEELEELVKWVESVLPGTWAGSFDEFPDEPDFLFTFTADGHYTFTAPGGYEEDGTYTMSHVYEAYHTTLHMTPSTERNRGLLRYELIISIDDSAPLRMHVKDAEYPTFEKQ